MTIEEFYAGMGADVKTILQRLGTEALVKKYLGKMLGDGSFAQLASAMDDARWEDAFRAAHSLKGICLNLEFPPLMRSSSALTEALRVMRIEEARTCFVQVKSDYEALTAALREVLK